MKVLITAATRHGSTMEIARIIGGILQDRGIDTDIVEPDSVSSLADYDGVILGSAVYMGRWLEPARQLIGRCSGDFVGRSVWLFSSGPLGDPAKPDGEPVDVEAIRAATGAIDHKVFPGQVGQGGAWLRREGRRGRRPRPRRRFPAVGRRHDLGPRHRGPAANGRPGHDAGHPGPDPGRSLTVSRRRGPSCGPRTRQPAPVARG